MSNNALLKGTAFLMISQIVFLVCGYGVHIFLAREFGPDLYGNFGVIISILIWFELAVIRGIPTAVQNYIAQDQRNAYAIKKFFFYAQLGIATVLFLVLLLSAPLLAKLLNDERLTYFIRIAAFDLIIYAAYALYVSIQNGLREFRKQAIIVSCYSITRLIAILSLVMIGLSLSGALIGNIIGSLGGLILGILFCKLDKKKAVNFYKKEAVKFVIPTTLFFLVSNLLYNIDLWFVKSNLVNEAAGYYTSAQNLARIPLFVFLALSFTLLPLLSKAIKEGKHQEAIDYIHQALRILALILIPVILVVISTSESLIEMFYSKQYIPSASILKILIIAFGFLAFYTSMTTVMIAKNKPEIPLLLTLGLVLFDFFLINKLIPVWGTLGAAASTTLTAAVGSVVIGVLVFKDYKLNFKLLSFTKITIAALIIFGISNLYSIKAEWLIMNYIILFSFYIGLLVYLQEISAEELITFKKILIK